VTAGELAALMLALAAVLSALAALITALLTYTRLGQVHDAVNGQSRRLNNLTARSSFAAGQLAGPDIPPAGSGGTRS
jgi:hypothetical protein